MRVMLKVVKGSSAGKLIPVPQGEFFIGRGEDCQLRPRSDAISRRHCQLVATESQVSIRDLGSKNGTYINGDRLEGETQLMKGDSLKVGPLVFEVMTDHSLGGAKRSRVKDVSDVAKRTSTTATIDDCDVSQWLEEADEVDREQRMTDPETRQYKLDETDQVALSEADDATSETALDENGEEKEEPEKKEPGKLPRQEEKQAKDSTEAASEMLKKYFKQQQSLN